MSTESPSAQRAPDPAPPESTTRLHPGLWALAAGGFGIGLTEFMIAGLLSDVAADFSVSIPVAGLLISGYAIAVVIGAFTVTAYLASRPPKAALLVLLGLFVVGNGLVAAAPDFTVAVIGRVITAMCHGGFFGIGAVLAVDLVAPQRRASALAVMFGGLTAANVLGVPFGTLVGQQLGWRTAFWIICGFGLIAMAGIGLAVPRRPASGIKIGSQYSVLARPQVIVSILLTTLIFGGMFGAFMYIEPLATTVTGYSQAAVPWLLLLFGLGLFVGNILGGKAADKNLEGTLRVLAVLLVATLIVYALVTPWKVPLAVVLFLLGLIGFATTPALQLRVMRYADDAPTLASAANIGAFNLGNAIGVALGGVAISAGLGWVSPIWVGAVMTAAGAVLLFVPFRGRWAR